MEFDKIDKHFLQLIHATPNGYELAKQLNLKLQFLSRGSYFTRCRRMYDLLLLQGINLDESECNKLRPLFATTGNFTTFTIFLNILENTRASQLLSNVAEDAAIVLSVQNLAANSGFKIASSWESLNEEALSGNFSRFKGMLRFVAGNCVKINTPNPSQPKSKSVNHSEFGKFICRKDGEKQRTLLHAVVLGKSFECLSILMKYAGEIENVKACLLDSLDEDGNTALHLAVINKLPYHIKKLVLEGACFYISSVTNDNALHLIQHSFPEVLPFILSCSISKSDGQSKNTKEYLRIDFGPIAFVDLDEEIANNNLAISDQVEPLYTNTTDKNRPKEGQYVPEMSTLNHLCLKKTVTPEILTHPVVEEFLRLKWKRLRWVVWLGYTFFRASIYCQMVVAIYWLYFMLCPRQTIMPSEENSGASALQNENNSTLLQTTVCDRPKIGWISIWLLIASMGTLFINFLDILQHLNLTVIRGCSTSIDKKTFYLLFRVAFEVISGMALVVPSVWPLFTDEIGDWLYCYASASVLLSSVLVLRVISNSNFHWLVDSIYIHVYWRVMKRFLGVLVTFSPLVAAFSYIFNILYPYEQQFATFWRSLFRVFAMVQGELDYESITYNEQTADIRADDQWLFWTTQLIFIILGFVLTLLVLDVFLGYTVSDIQALQDQAVFNQTTNHVFVMNKAETDWVKFLGIFFSRKWILKIRWLRGVITLEDKFRHEYSVTVEVSTLPVSVQYQMQQVIEQDEWHNAGVAGSRTS